MEGYFGAGTYQCSSSVSAVHSGTSKGATCNLEDKCRPCQGIKAPGCWVCRDSWTHSASWRYWQAPLDVTFRWRPYWLWASVFNQEVSPVQKQILMSIQRTPLDFLRLYSPNHFNPVSVREQKIGHCLLNFLSFKVWSTMLELRLPYAGHYTTVRVSQ